MFKNNLMCDKNNYLTLSYKLIYICLISLVAVLSEYEERFKKWRTVNKNY